MSLLESLRAALRAAFRRVGPSPTERIDPQSLLFTLPTISDDLPPVDPPTTPSGHVVILHEDSWRQIELRPAATQRDIQAELDRIAAFKATHAKALGFTQTYVRQVPGAPLPIPSGLLSARFSGEALGQVFLSMAGATHRVHGAAMAALEGAGVLYALADRDRCSVLGLALIGPKPPEGDLAPLAAIARDFDLVLVDWVGVELIAAGDEAALREWVGRAVARQNARDDELFPSSN